MTMLIRGYDDLICGDEDDESPVVPLIRRALARAKEDDDWLRVEIRTTALGEDASRQEGILKVMNTCDPGVVCKLLADALVESPGERFVGKIQVNFTAASCAGVKYGSWTRQVRVAPRPVFPISLQESGADDR